MASRSNDAELRFRATLDDDISSKADKLERKLQQMGKSPAEIRMILRAVDEATPKIKEVQKHADQLPREHVMQIRANHTGAMRDIDMFRKKQEEPVKMRFEGLDGALEKMKEMFSLRTKITGPLGAVPGVGQLYGMGAGAGVAGIASAGIGGVAQGVQIQSRMEQSMVTLDQTLKDTGKARDEMRQLVDFAIKTPFNYQDVLAADVRLRSYQIPTMPGDPGSKNSPGDQGWLKASGDMAAAMQTPITQAVEAVADAKQGYFVRMMTYGIRMMREDFEKGGKYAGLSYEQGLERALKRFDGSMAMQATTFKGVMSNLQDVLQNKILAGAGAVPFGFVKDKATQLQDKLQTPEMQEKIGAATERFNKAFVQTLDMIRKSKEYFELNLEQPLIKIVKLAEHVGMLFAKAFGGTTGFVLKTLATTFLSIAEAVAEIANQFPGLFQFFGVMKALSMLGFTNISAPFTKLQSGLNPLTFSLKNIFGGIVGIPRSAMMIGVGLLVKGFLDAHQATKTLNEQFKEMNSRGLDKLNADISKMAVGLGVSSTELKNLTALAASGLPTGKGHIQGAERVAELGIAASRQFGMDKKDAVRAITGEANLQGDFRKDSFEKFYTSLGGAKSAADELKIKFKDLALAATVFKGATNKVGLEGLEGMPMLGGLMSAASGMQMTDKQARLYGSPTEVVRAILEEGGSPSNETLKRIGSGSLDKYFDFKKGGRQFDESRTILQGINDTYAQNVQKDRDARRLIGKIAPDATVMSTPMPWTKADFGAVNAFGSGGPQTSPDRQAAMLAEGLEQVNKRAIEASEMVNTITDKINKLSNASRLYSAAIEDINKKMSIWQQSHMVPLQRQIEDVGLAVQEYTLNKLRPLERQMNRLSQAGAELGNTMQNAQYDLQKFASGLLPGEQAVLDNLHGLERYNKQLQLLQLIHHSMGSELGVTTFERGFSSRVQPLFGLSLQMQMERAQKRQQREQLEYELGAGEQHYKLQQAGRSKFERQEMSFQERMSGVKEAVGIIDTTSEAQHKLTNVQHALQRQVFKVNEYLADQGDKIARMQLNLQKLAQSNKMRDFQDEQFNLGIKMQEANKQLERQNTALARWTEKGQDIKQIAKAMKDEILDMLDWGDKPEKNAKALAKLAVAAGIITKKQLPDFLKTLGDAGDAATEGRKTAGQWREHKASWKDVIRQGVEGAFTGDLWRKLGDIAKGATGQQGIGSMISIGGTAATLAIATGVAGVLGTQAVRVVASRLIQTSFAGPALRGAAGLGASALGRLPFGWSRGLSGSWARVAEGGAIATGGLGGRLLEQLRLMTRLRSLFGAGVGSLIGGVVGGPPGSMLGGYVGGRVAGGTPVRQWIGIRRVFAPFNNAVDRFKTTVGLADKANDTHATRLGRFGTRLGEIREHFSGVAGRFGGTVGRFGRIAGRFGRAGGVMAAAAVLIKDAGGLFSGAMDKIKSIPFFNKGDEAKPRPNRIPGSRQASEAGAIDDAKHWLSDTRSGRAVRSAAKVAGVTLDAAALAAIGYRLQEGDTGAQIATGIGAVTGVRSIRALGGGNFKQGLQALSKAPVKGGAEAGVLRIGGRVVARFIPGAGWALTAYDLNSFLNNLKDPARGLKLGEEHSELERDRIHGLKTRWHEQDVSNIKDVDFRPFKKVEDENKNHHKRVSDEDKKDIDDTEKRRDRHGKSLVQILTQRGGEQFAAHDKGLHKISDVTRLWLGKVARTVRGIDKDFGLTSDKSGPGTGPGNTHGGHPSSGSPDVLAHGGWVMGAQIPKGKLVRVGEEGHDEVVIPLAPHRRHRAISLMNQVAGRIGGYAGGGIIEAMPGRDMAYMTARGAYAQAVQSFANGGLTGPYGSGAAFTPVSNFAMKKFGLTMTAGRTNHDRMTASGNVSDHSWGGAGDFSNGILTPQEDAFAAFWKTKGRAMIKQLIWRNKDQFNGAFIGGHENHVHVALQRQYAFDQERMAKILSNLSEGLSIRALLASAGTGDVAELTLPGVPKKLKHMGPIGRRIAQALRRKKRQWEKTGGGPGGGDFSNIKGGGSALMKAISKREGWNFADWWEVDRRETGHGTNLFNESSGAALRGQFMPGITQGHYGPGSDPGAHPSMRQQIISMARYIKSRYPGGPTEALAHHDKFNWYKQGAYNIPDDNHRALLHKGEMVLPTSIASKVREKLPGAGDDSRLVKLTRIIEDIQAHIKKAEHHLQTLNDKTDKRNQRAELSDLNSRLRDRLQQRARATSSANRRLARVLTGMGDRTGGEDTLAGVQKERGIFRRTMRRAVKPARAKLKRARRNLQRIRKKARSRKSPGGRRITRGERKKIQRARQRVMQARRGVQRARQRGRANYLVGAADRGVNARLIRQITGKGLSREQSQAYKRLSNIMARAQKDGRVTAAETRRINQATRQLRQSLRTEHNKSRANSNKNHSRTASRVRDSVHKSGASSRAAAASRHVDGKQHGDKRDNKHMSVEEKRESKKEQEETKREKRMLKLLEQIARKDLTVNIHNEAHGATLTTRRQTNRRRGR